jgi:hypothetical protein
VRYGIDEPWAARADDDVVCVRWALPACLSSGNAAPSSDYDFLGVGTGRPAIFTFTDPSVFLLVK